MTEEQERLTLKAAENIRIARVVLSNDSPEIAATRAYYAMFYLGCALLLEKELKYSSHAGVMGALGREFAAKGEIPVKYHQYLLKAYAVRANADYNLKQVINAEEAQTQIIRAQEFYEFAAEYFRPRSKK